MKGAPEQVLDRCDFILRDGELLEKNTQTTKAIKKSILNLGRKGERILALADLELPEKYGVEFCFDAEAQNFPMNGTVFRIIIKLFKTANLILIFSS